MSGEGDWEPKDPRATPSLGVLGAWQWLSTVISVAVALAVQARAPEHPWLALAIGSAAWPVAEVVLGVALVLARRAL